MLSSLPRQPITESPPLWTLRATRMTLELIHHLRPWRGDEQTDHTEILPAEDHLITTINPDHTGVCMCICETVIIQTPQAIDIYHSLH